MYELVAVEEQVWPERIAAAAIRRVPTINAKTIIYAEFLEGWATISLVYEDNQELYSPESVEGDVLAAVVQQFYISVLMEDPDIVAFVMTLEDGGFSMEFRRVDDVDLSLTHTEREDSEIKRFFGKEWVDPSLR